MPGILLVDKPKGITSHRVVQEVRRIFGTRRVGHAGTLDPLASGLLVIAIEQATRFLNYLNLEPKEYETTACFGVETTTQDAEGIPTLTLPVPQNLGELVVQSLPQFLGSIEQIPPMYSAVKKEGRPLYKYAREGVEIERVPRPTQIYSFSTLGMDPPLVKFKVVCSGGTYIRTLIHDLGKVVGCGAHVSELRRTRVGEFSVSNGMGLESLSRDHLIPLQDALQHLPSIRISRELESRVRHGQMVQVPKLVGDRAVLLDDRGEVIALAIQKDNNFQPIIVVPQ